MKASRPLRAIVGARVSSFNEGKESQITQRDKGIAFAESQGWDVVGTFEDLDVSAIKLSPWKRPDLAVWLDERSDDWEALIFAKTDRVFRSANDCVVLAEWCKTHRKVLVLVDDGIKLDYHSAEDSRDAFAGAMSKVFLILASVFAEIEGQRFVQRANDRVTQYQNQPRWAYGVPPYGFKTVDRPGGGKILAHDDDAQRVLHRIAARLAAGDSLTRITSQLNEDGVPSPSDRLRQRSGKTLQGSRWTTVTVKAIMGSAATQGVKTAKSRPVLDADGEYVMVGPPSFDANAWTQIQQALAQRSQSGKHRQHSGNPLLGVAKCGSCGRNMRQTQKSEQSNRYYVCGDSPKPCPGVLARADDVEGSVLDAFMSVHAGRRVVTRVWREGSDRSTELAQTVATIERLREDRLLGLFSSVADEETYRSQMLSLVTKRDELAKLPTVESGWVTAEGDRTYGDVWPAATLEERRALLVAAGMKVIVYKANHYETVIELENLLGDGPLAVEVFNAIAAGQAAAREAAGITDE